MQAKVMCNSQLVGKKLVGAHTHTQTFCDNLSFFQCPQGLKVAQMERFKQVLAILPWKVKSHRDAPCELVIENLR